MNRRSLFALWTVLLTALGLLLVPAAAHAATNFDNMYPIYPLSWTCRDQSPGGGQPCQTDNASLTTFHESSVDALHWGWIKGALHDYFEPTDLSVVYSATPSYSGSSETDVIYRVNDGNVPAGSDAVTWCDNAVTAVKCDQAYVAFNTQSGAAYPLTCHETGHAVGLVHGMNASPRVSNTDPGLGCMARPTSSGVSLGAHNIAEINATY